MYDDVNDVVTKDEIADKNAILETLLNKGKECDKLLADICNESNIELADVGKILSQSVDHNQIHNTEDVELEQLKSELDQLLLERTSETSKKLESEQKLLVEKKVEQSALERKYRKLMNKIESFNH